MDPPAACQPATRRTSTAMSSRGLPSRSATASASISRGDGLAVPPAAAQQLHQPFLPEQADQGRAPRSRRRCRRRARPRARGSRRGPRRADRERRPGGCPALPPAPRLRRAAVGAGGDGRRWPIPPVRHRPRSTPGVRHRAEGDRSAGARGRRSAAGGCGSADARALRPPAGCSAPARLPRRRPGPCHTSPTTTVQPPPPSSRRRRRSRHRPHFLAPVGRNRAAASMPGISGSSAGRRLCCSVRAI